MVYRGMLVASVALAFALGCDGDKAAGKGSPAPPSAGSGAGASVDAGAAQPTPATGLPRGRDGAPVSAPSGGQLKDRWTEAAGDGWIYVYERGEPAAMIGQVRQALVAAGAAPVVVRELPQGRLPSRPTAAFAAFGARMVTVTAYLDPRDQVWMTIVASPLDQLVTAPDGYPAGFPFLPFAVRDADAPPGRVGLLYNSTTVDLTAELGQATTAAGWSCAGIEPAVCTKAGQPEVIVTVGVLSSGRVALVVASQN